MNSEKFWKITERFKIILEIFATLLVVMPVAIALMQQGLNAVIPVWLILVICIPIFFVGYILGGQAKRKHYSKPKEVYFPYLEADKLLIDNLKKKHKIQPIFLEWSQFTLLFWVNITEQFFDSENNKYFFSYTTDSNDKSGYPNGFYLGKQGGSMVWRLMVKGPDVANSTEFLFSTAESLKGWKLISIRWDSRDRSLKFDIDGGRVFSLPRQINEAYWPKNIPGHLFHFGGWLDNWPGGLALLEFHGFRIYKTSLSDSELQQLFIREGKFVRNL